MCPYCNHDCSVGYGMCHCGCGAKTNIATSTYTTSLGHRIVKGAPSMYRNGHRAKKHSTTVNSALNAKTASIIRAIYAYEDIAQVEIARMFQVSAAAICKILMFDSYKDAGIATKKELEDYYSSFPSH